MNSKKMAGQKRKEVENASKNKSGAKKSRKQKNTTESTPKNAADDLMKAIDEHFLVKHPAELLDFWEHILALKPDSPTEACSELLSLKLVGPFALLEDLSKNAASAGTKDFLIGDRFSTDLPEMQTLMLYRGGRFCYWRDVPSEPPAYIVHVPNEPGNFPAFTIVGDANPCCALAFLAAKDENKCNKDLCNRLIPNTFNLAKYGQNVKTLKNQRNKISLGKPFHGMGIKVEVNEKDIGYRPVTDNLPRLKQEIVQMGTTDSEAEKKVLKEALFKIYSYVQFANDEMDFGMGLEFGHDLFMSNYACFDGMAKSVLCTAYGLLGRKEFAIILERQWEHGRRANDMKLMN